MENTAESESSALSMSDSRAASVRSSPSVKGTHASMPDAGICIFTVDGNQFAIDTALVGEVATIEAVLQVPLAPPSIIGLFNLRGTPIAAVDLHSVLGRPSRPRGREANHVMLVLRTTSTLAALRIDRLNSVVPSGRGKRVLNSRGGDHPAVVGLFEPGPGLPGVILLGSEQLVESLLKVSFSKTSI